MSMMPQHDKEIFEDSQKQQILDANDYQNQLKAPKSLITYQCSWKKLATWRDESRYNPCNPPNGSYEFLAALFISSMAKGRKLKDASITCYLAGIRHFYGERGTIISLRITHLCIKNFCVAKPPPSSIEISNRLLIPLSLAAHLLFQLFSAKILSEVKRDNDREIGFQPALSVDQLTIKSVIDMINTRVGEIPLSPSPDLDLILNSLEKFNLALEKSDGNVLLKEI